tara:strand:- start:2310 stop:2498 length:189 start_codon:yes stop_codon:yes gene_type:complete
MPPEESTVTIKVSIEQYNTQIEVPTESWETFQALSNTDYLEFRELIKTTLVATYTDFVNSKS